MGAVAVAAPASYVDVTVPYKPRRWALPFHATKKRKSVLVLHRRAGKTVGEVNHAQRYATDDQLEAERLRFLEPSFTDAHIRELLRARHYAVIFPTYKQAKLVAWEKAKYYASTIPGAVPNEVDLAVRYPNGSKVQLFGADNPDSLRGPAFSGAVFDEYQDHPTNIYGEIISKALADHLGWVVLGGTIKGKNQLYKTYQAAKNDPEWFALWQDVDASLETEDGATIIALRRAMEDDRADVANGITTQAEFDQEWYLSPEAAIRGAIYGELIAEARKAGRLTRVPYDPSIPVDTDWDLGVGDNTSIWFSQSLYTGEVRVIDFYEASGEGLPHYKSVLDAKGYTYGTHWAPHDIQQRELTSGNSRLEIARKLGLHFQVAPRIQALEERIHAARMFLPRCYFDEVRCEDGIEALTHYRWAFNEQLQEQKPTPVHDWASHAADSFGGLAYRWYLSRRNPDREAARELRAAQRDPGESFQWNKSRAGRGGY